MVYHTERKEACATTAVHIVMESGKGRKIFQDPKLIKNIMTIFLAVATSILVDFWIFSDQAQLLDPESAASKDVGAQIRSCCVN